MSSNPLLRVKKKNNISSPLRRTPVSRREFIQNPNAVDERDRNSVGASPSSSRNSSPGPNKMTEQIKNITKSSLSSIAASSSGGTGSYTDFTLRACNYDDIKDARHHIIKFHSKSHVDPAKQFTPPIRFHRKDPRNLQFQLTLSEMQERQEQAENQEKQDASDSSKSNKPQADMSLVAPEGGARRQKMPFQKKTRQVQAGNEAGKKLRYEEYYPWMMEDFDGKNTWVGNYEAAQSDTYCLFVFDSDGFRMVPAEKWYKMTPRNKYMTLTLEEAEQRMEQKQNAPRWVMKKLGIEQQQSGTSHEMNMRRSFRTVEGGLERRQGPSRGATIKRGDEDELDFDEEFADDEEAPIMEGNEEDLKEVETKLKKERQGAHFGADTAETGDVEEDENRRIDKEGRKLKKYLRSLEKNTSYDSDEEQNPYMSEEESEDDDEVAIKTEEKTKTQTDSKDLAAAEASLQQKLAKRSMVKKEYKNLATGMVILQLTPGRLTRFPQGVWNPNAKRRRAESPDHQASDASPSKSKKIKIKQGTPPAEESQGLLTEGRVRDLLSSKRLKTDELLAILKPDLKANTGNAERLKAILRKIAKLNKGYLLLKETTPS